MDDALLMQVEALVCFAHGPGPELPDAAGQRSLVFFRSALQAVVGFESWTIRTHYDLGVVPTRIENDQAFGVGAEEVHLGTLPGCAGDRDECVCSDELLLERLWLSQGVARHQDKPERGHRGKTEPCTLPNDHVTCHRRLLFYRHFPKLLDPQNLFDWEMAGIAKC